MIPMLQSKLLRVLQERQFERVGGIKTIKTDIRIIAATHQNLKALVQQRKFREDLYYRLNVIPLEIPPLRERKTDIPLLAHYFLDQFNRRKKKKIRGIREDAMARLLQYAWPGNVRELENTIERVIILLDGDLVTSPDLPDKFHEMPGIEPAQAAEMPESGISLDDAVNEFEKKLILQALIKTGWVKNKAAQLLNLNRTTLIEKIKRQNLQPPHP
jgi:transcriptional regulator with PAS, ATPase and Fis domain